MKTSSLALLAVLIFPALASAQAAEPAVDTREAAPDKAAAVATSAAKPAAEDWGIWNRAPRRAGRDPLLALGQRERAPTPEPIDAAARGDSTSGTVGRDEIDLNAWDSGRIELPPPKPDAGN
ncbi:MAG: hypothetical protein H4O13_10225 [Xanthomonadales bacterium]|nr:hypothetical protein [Xanthomonadales bacterium]